jgi:peptidoglycan/xylan/chitin deacetylase (PgdA/CDA1 family)
VLPRKLTIVVDGDRYEWDFGAAAEYSESEYARDIGLPVWRGEEGSRLRRYHEVYSALNSLPSQSRFEAVEHIVSWSGIDLIYRAQNRPLTIRELRELASCELISIGAHSVSHAPLKDKSYEFQANEISRSQSMLQEILQQNIELFAYPHGKFDQVTIELLEESGFRGACTTIEDYVRADTDALLLPRFQAKDSDEVVALHDLLA